MKNWDVTVKIFGIPEDEYERFLTDLEELAQGKGLVCLIGMDEEAEETILYGLK